MKTLIASLLVTGGLILAAGTGGASKKTAPPQARPFTGAPPGVPAPDPGVGMAMPHLADGQRLYFYGIVDFTQMPDMLTPLDSVVFVAGPYHVAIKTAPPWFLPEVMKMDYDLLFLRAMTISKNWIEVVVNRLTGETRWVDAQAVRFVDWPRFLLDVAAVEVPEAGTNPIRIKPLGHASILADAPGIPLPVLGVRGSWLQVATIHVADRIPPWGWIRWREDDRLLISYSPLQ